jgi:hypothetical protein
MNNIIISDPTVIKFFNINKHIKPDDCMLLIIDLYNNIKHKASYSIDKNISDMLLENNQLLFNQLDNLAQKINNPSYNLKNNILSKITTTKHQHIDYITSSTQIKVDEIIAKNDEYCFEEPQHIVSDIATNTIPILVKNLLTILPKSIINSYENILDTFGLFEKNILDNIQLIKNKEIDNHTKTITTKNMQQFKQFNLETIQLYIDNFSEEFDKFSSTLIENISESITIDNLIVSHTNKYNNQKTKETMSENKLRNLLTHMYPSAEVIDTSNNTAQCHCMLVRPNSTKILFEIKEDETNIQHDQVDKFICDCQTNKLHGIFLSNKTGISGKNDYEINYINNCILVYVHYANYSEFKIRAAVDIIDTIHKTLTELNPDNTENHIIDKKLLNDINTEYQLFITKKKLQLDALNDYNKKMENLINDNRLPSLELLLKSKFSQLQINNSNLTCKRCNAFTYTLDTRGKKSYATHRNYCRQKYPDYKSSSDDERDTPKPKTIKVNNNTTELHIDINKRPKKQIYLDLQNPKNSTINNNDIDINDILSTKLSNE